MALRLVQVNLKARDDEAVGRFWAEALGWNAGGAHDGATSVTPEGFRWPDSHDVVLDVIRVPDPETVRHRVHIDLATTSERHQRELVARLIGLGATPADIGQGDVPWTVLADPEGNLFCVLEPREVYRDTGPIAAVVVDCAEPRRFWTEALGWTAETLTDDFVRMRRADTGPYLEFSRNDGDLRHRSHLDLVGDIEPLLALGATVVNSDFRWTVLADPEGQEFCLL
ncbi:VOC family protein [Actinoplanes sp. NPDC023714]|uniref:VOC family protein n=1 Tax=Actinoplanes sp. NPDC023714 TaxID=3154322 RepID=UPI0033F1D2BA